MDDCRQGGKVIYRLHDCLMSAFAMMLFQDSSLNTLKNQGYHLDLTDRLYQAVRYTKFTSRSAQYPGARPSGDSCCLLPDFTSLQS